MPSTEPTAEEIVAGPAVTGDLHGEMRRAARPFSRTTQVLAGLVVLAAVFAGGASTHAAFGSTSAPAPARQAAAPSGQGQPGGLRGAAGRGTTGTIDRVDGAKVYVKNAQGSEVTVSTTDDTTIGVTQAGKLSDLKPGSTVVVQGQAGEDGTVAARSITQEAGR